MNFRSIKENCEMFEIYIFFHEILYSKLTKLLSKKFNIQETDVARCMFWVKEYFFINKSISISKKIDEHSIKNLSVFEQFIETDCLLSDTLKQFEYNQMRKLEDALINIVIFEQFIFSVDKNILIENQIDFFTFPKDMNEELNNIIINSFRTAGFEFGLRIINLEKGYFIYWDKYHSNKYGLKDYGINRFDLMVKNKGNIEKCDDQIRRILK